MSSPSIRLVRQGFPQPPGLSTAVSAALLRRVSAGEVGETFRIHVPGRLMAFSKGDKHSPGFDRAVEAALAAGYSAVNRLAGGRAALFNEQTLAFAWTLPDPDPAPSIQQRFRDVSSLMVRAFARLGIEARVGEVPGEYCPGRYSVNHGGSLKLMGVGQRLSRGAAHVGGVIVVSGSESLRSVLIPVYEALAYQWRPQTAGSLSDIVPGITTSAAEDAVLKELAELAELEPTEIDPETLRLAERLLPDHVL